MLLEDFVRCGKDWMLDRVFKIARAIRYKYLHSLRRYKARKLLESDGIGQNGGNSGILEKVNFLIQT